MKICFVSPDAYSLLNESTTYIFGGAEVRAVTLAKELQNFKDFQISFIVKDHFNNTKKNFSGIEVLSNSKYKGQGYWDHSNTLRFKMKVKKEKLFSSEKKENDKVFRDVAADVFIAFGFSDMALDALVFAKTNHKKFVFSFATDAELQNESSGNDKFKSLITDSDKLICQTNWQSEQLAAVYKRSGWLMPNPVSLKKNKVSGNSGTEYALWVGKTSEQKQPLRFLNLAKKFPGTKFKMILNNTDRQLYKQIESEKPANLDLLESLPFNAIEECFANCNFFVNTSKCEGFPNTFLQSFKYSKPVLSYEVDSGKVLSEHHCGLCAFGSENIFYSLFGKLQSDPGCYKELSANAFAYVNKFHNAEKIAKDFAENVLV